MQFTFIFNFRQSPPPLPRSKEYRFCRGRSDTGSWNGTPAVGGGVGRPSPAPLLYPPLIYILSFVSFWWLDVIFPPRSPAGMLRGSPLPGSVM